MRGFFIGRLAGLFTLLFMGTLAFAAPVPRDYQQVQQILGRQGTYEQNVFQILLPWQQQNIEILGWRVPAEFGFTGMLSMTAGSRGQRVLLGEFVLRQQEVNPIISSLLKNKFQVTAVHNHYLGEAPRAIFMHFNGTGSAADLARRVKPALDLIGNVTAPGWMADTASTTTPATPPNFSINTRQFDNTIGEKGKMQPHGVYEYAIDRKDIRLVISGARITERMGLHIEADIMGSEQNAGIDSEMALLPSEVPGVERALRNAGIPISAVHNHFIGTNPEIIFLHFEGRGTAVQLARAFRAALQATAVK